MAITVRFVADVVNWLSGLSKSEDAVEDNEKALEDLMAQAIQLGREAGKTTDQIARDFSQAFGVPVDRAKRAIEEVVDEGSRLDEIGDAATDAGRKMESGIGDAAAGAQDSLSELGSIAKDVLEGDFSGAAESAVSSLMSVAGFAGAGGVLAGLLAVGIGSIVSHWIGEWQRAAEETEQRISDMYNDMLDSGNRYLSAQFIQKGIAEITGDQDRYNEALAKSKELGVGVNDVIRAMAGDQAAVTALLDDQAAKRQTELDLVKQSGESLADQQIKIDAINAKYTAQNDLLTGVASTLDTASDRAAAAESATSDYLKSLITSASEATVEIDELGNKLVTLPTDEKILIEADTGRATTNITTFKGDLDGIPDKTVNVKAIVDDSAVRNWHPPMLPSATMNVFPKLVTNSSGNLVRAGQNQYTG